MPSKLLSEWMAFSQIEAEKAEQRNLSVEAEAGLEAMKRKGRR